MTTHESLKVRLKSITYEAEDIVSLDLRPIDAPSLPHFTSGAHVELRLPNGIERSYSIASPQSETHRYLIGVQNDPVSRGGSRFIHENLRVGTELVISAPRNNFKLDESAEQTMLIAGGIGVTPIWCMAQRLAELGRPFKVVFAARSRRRAAFLDGITALLGQGSPNLILHFDDESGGRSLDMATILRDVKRDVHLYCCGPLPMLAAFEAATADRAEDTVHVEYFAAKQPVDTAGGFEVVLARAGKSFAIPPGETILDTLLKNGVDVPHSCREGVCGTCEVSVVEGIPDHRDAVLSAKERAGNRTIMVCCSGSKSQKLVLDL